jgi:hypothetical protein
MAVPRHRHAATASEEFWRRSRSKCRMRLSRREGDRVGGCDALASRVMRQPDARRAADCREQRRHGHAVSAGLECAGNAVLLGGEVRIGVRLHAELGEQQRQRQQVDDQATGTMSEQSGSLRAREYPLPQLNRQWCSVENCGAGSPLQGLSRIAGQTSPQASLASRPFVLLLRRRKYNADATSTSRHRPMTSVCVMLDSVHSTTSALKIGISGPARARNTYCVACIRCDRTPLHVRQSERNEQQQRNQLRDRDADDEMRAPAHAGDVDGSEAAEHRDRGQSPVTVPWFAEFSERAGPSGRGPRCTRCRPPSESSRPIRALRPGPGSRARSSRRAAPSSRQTDRR